MISSNRNLSCGMPYIRPSLKKKPLPLFIKCFLLTGFSAAIFSSPYSFAQEESDDDVQESSGSSALEEVVITGIRASQRGAIDLKKEAGTMVDAIIAEDVSKFPDKNVTEAVQRIPGVQITRDFGEGAGINIRGMEQGLNRIEFDGVSALGDGSRNVALTDTASELVKVLTVIKGSEARITEGGIGGTVQIEMRKANDFDDHFFSASFENQYNDLSQEHSPDANITGVYKFSDDFGVMANLNFSDKQTMIHALRNTEWSRWADYDNSPEKSVVDADYADFNSASECTDAYGPNGEDNSEALRDCQKQWWDFGPRLPRYGNWGREESRISSNIGFGWDVNDKLSVFADYTYNERDKLATDYNLSIGTGSVSGVDPDSVVVDENHNIRAFTSADAEVVNRTLKFDWLQKKSLFKIGADYIGDKIEINGIVSASETEQDIDSRDAQITSSGVAGVEFLLDEQGAPQFDLTSGYRYQDPLNDPDPGEFELFDVNNPASYNARARYKYAPVEQQQTEDSAKVDFAYNFDEGKFITKARTGLRWAKATLESQNFENNIIRDVGNFYARLDENGNVVLDDDGEVIRDEWTLDRHLELISGSTTETPRFFPSFDLGVGTLESYQAVHTDTLISRLEQEARAGVSRASLQPRRGKYYIEEESYAGYVQIDFSQPIAGLDFWGNVGVRVVKTETVSEGDVIIDAVYDVGTEEFNGNQPIIWDWNGSALDLNAQPNYTEDDIVDKNQTVEFQTFSGRDTSEGSYTDVLPSINLNLALIPDELTLYAGAAKVMSRPAIDVLNINADCTRYANLKAREENTDNKCDAGNPNINHQLFRARSNYRRCRVFCRG